MSRQTSGSMVGTTSEATSRGWSPSVVALLGLILAVGSTPAHAEDEAAAENVPEVKVERPEGNGKAGGREQRAGGRGGAPRSTDDVIERMTGELSLTEKQQSEARQIFEAQRERGEALRKEVEASGDRSAAREKMQAIRAETQGKIDAILDEEQRSKLSELRAQRKSRGQGQGRGQGRGGRQGRQGRQGGGARGAP